MMDEDEARYQAMTKAERRAEVESALADLVRMWETPEGRAALVAEWGSDRAAFDALIELLQPIARARGQRLVVRPMPEAEPERPVDKR